MNRTLPEMLHSLNTPANLSGGTDLTVLDRQQARMKWQQQQQPGFFNGNEQLGGFSQDFSGLISTDMGMGTGELVNPMVKPDPGVETGWADPGYRHYGYGNAGFEMGNAISRTISCPPAVEATAVVPAAAAVADEKLVSGVGRESFKKRKADKNQNLKVVAEEDTKEKRSKNSGQDGDIKEKNSGAKKNETANTNNKETSNDTSKENSKVTEVQKPDYIHVRARRGQATDSHSLAERVRREKISERMKYLQDLVPGCNKITGKAGMLDEIINYVQSLQRQVEFLSMKLAAVNPRLDFSIDNFFTKEIFPASTSSFPAIGVSPEMVNPSFFEINQLQQLVSCGLEMGISPSDMAIRRTTSAPITIPETFLDSSCFNQIQLPSTWDAELQNLYGVEFQHARSTFLSQQFTGPMEGDNSKTGM